MTIAMRHPVLLGLSLSLAAACGDDLAGVSGDPADTPGGDLQQ
jgi:hypothetical protein